MASSSAFVFAVVILYSLIGIGYCAGVTPGLYGFVLTDGEPKFVHVNPVTAEITILNDVFGNFQFAPSIGVIDNKNEIFYSIGLNRSSADLFGISLKNGSIASITRLPCTGTDDYSNYLAFDSSTNVLYWASWTCMSDDNTLDVYKINPQTKDVAHIYGIYNVQALEGSFFDINPKLNIGFTSLGEKDEIYTFGFYLNNGSKAFASSPQVTLSNLQYDSKNSRMIGFGTYKSGTKWLISIVSVDGEGKTNSIANFTKYTVPQMTTTGTLNQKDNIYYMVLADVEDPSKQYLISVSILPNSAHIVNEVVLTSQNYPATLAYFP